MANAYYDKLMGCVEVVKGRLNGFTPRLALVLGSGLGPIADTMDVQVKVPYSEIPGMPVSTVPGHQGQFLFGTIGGVPVVCMQGRLHYYEGYDVHDVVLPTRIMGCLGAKTLFLTNAAGGLDPELETPSLMVISDHIMFHFPNPLVGQNLDELGTRFPDMSAVYDPAIRTLLKKKGEAMGLPMSEGIYVQLTGPSFETPTEVRLLGRMGGSAVGMSTACEAVAARHMGMRVCGISCITNKGAGIAQHALTHQEVVEAGNLMGERFSALVTAVIPEIDVL
jgi:purine-nucleoside phosphorylase